MTYNQALKIYLMGGKREIHHTILRIQHWDSTKTVMDNAKKFKCSHATAAFTARRFKLKYKIYKGWANRLRKGESLT